MRRILVLGILLLLLLSVAAISVGETGNYDPMTLAAIGFVVLASFAVGEFGASLGLPKVTGYILAGVLLGPSVSDVLSIRVVGEMRMFNQLAVGLIALTAGLELELPGLRKVGRSLLATTGLKVLLLPILVGGMVLFVESTFHPLGVESSGGIWALAFVFSALAIGTSPAITLAVLGETGAKGRLASLTLGSAVLKDLVMVLALAFALAMGKSFTANEPLEAEVFVHLGSEIGLSLLVGAAVGGVLILYLRFVGTELLVFIVALVMVVAEVGEALHLEVLLTFITAGFVVRNFTDYAEKLHHPMEMVSLPVYVVFFTIAGAGVDLPILVRLVPFALALASARAGGFYLAGRFGAQFGGEDESVQSRAWLAYLPQAGVALGLIGLASEKLEELGDPITTLGIAFVSVNLIVGPLTQRFALTPPGAKKRGAGAADDKDLAGGGGDEEEDDELPEDGSLLPGPVEQLLSDARDRWEEGFAAQMRLHMSSMVASRRSVLESVKGVHASGGPGDSAWVTSLRPVDPEDAIRKLLNPLRVGLEHISRAPAVVEFEVSPDASATFSRWRAGVPGARRRARERRLPGRLLLRRALEPAMTSATAEVFAAACRAEARLIEIARNQALGRLGHKRVRSDGASVLERLEEEVQAILKARLRAAVREIREVVHAPRSLFSRDDGYHLSVDEVREIEASLRRDIQTWPRVHEAARREVELAAQLRHTMLRFADDVKATIDEPVGEGLAVLDEHVDGLDKRLLAIIELVEDWPPDKDGLLDEVQARVDELLRKGARRRIAKVELKLRRAVQSRELWSDLRSALANFQGTDEVLAVEEVPLWESAHPARTPVLKIALRSGIESEIGGRLLPQLEDLERVLWEQTVDIKTQLGEVADGTQLLLRIAREHQEEKPDAKPSEGVSAARRYLVEGIPNLEHRVRELGEGAVESFRKGVKQHRVLVEELHGELPGRLIAMVRGEPTLLQLEGARASLRRLFEQLRTTLEPVFARVGRTTRELLRTEAPFGDDASRRGLSRMLSARDLREGLASIEAAELPPLYRRLMTTEPVRDPRLFTAHREVLKAVLGDERRWTRDTDETEAVLVLGGPGSGKTSLLNQLQLKISGQRLIRLDLRDGPMGPLEALADAFDLPPDWRLVEEALSRAPVVVLVDDLQSSWAMDPAEDHLRALLHCIREAESAFWIVTMNQTAMEYVGDRMEIAGSFASVMELRELDATELSEVILSRHRLGGAKLSFPDPPPWLRPFRNADERHYFANLTRRSHGSIRTALAVWQATSRLEEEHLAIDDVPPPSDAYELLRLADEDALAMLGLLARGLELDLPGLERALRCGAERCAATLAFLLASGLCERHGNKTRLTPRHADEVSRVLAHLGVIPET